MHRSIQANTYKNLELNDMKFKSLTVVLLAAADLLLNPVLRAADNPALMDPVKSVLDHYLMIQTELAG